MDGMPAIECHAIDREAATPSAEFHTQNGVSVNFDGSQAKLSFDLAAAMGAYPGRTKPLLL
jgi:hypothetical protein